MELYVILQLVWFHCIADFILQTRKMAELKSSSNVWLGFHALVYAIPFTWIGIKYAIVTGILHFLVDWFSSRGTHHTWLTGNVRLFFIIIGVDQAIHMTFLVLTYIAMKGAL